jgi:hypothetical protein
MTDPTHSPRPHTLAAVRRSSLAAIGQRQLADGRTVDRRRAAREAYRAVRKLIPTQAALRQEAREVRAEIALLAACLHHPEDGAPGVVATGAGEAR